MVSVLDLMILCLDVDSVEDLPNFGSAEENPADSSINVILGIVRNLAAPAQDVFSEQSTVPHVCMPPK